VDSQGRDRDWQVGIGKMGSGFDLKIADRIQHENRSPIFPERFLIGIAIAITIRKSLTDFDLQIADRFPMRELPGSSSTWVIHHKDDE